jgi:hypothetical protein
MFTISRGVFNKALSFADLAGSFLPLPWPCRSSSVSPSFSSRSRSADDAAQLSNIYRLGVKELWSLWRDPIMLILIVFTFTFAIYGSASSMPETLHNAPIAIVDEDNSPLSQRIVSAFYPPQFMAPVMIAPAKIDPGMDAGIYTFAPYPFRLPARRPGWATCRGPAQHRRHPHDPGLLRERLYPADRAG